MTDAIKEARELAAAIESRFGPHVPEWAAGWKVGLAGGDAQDCPFPRTVSFQPKIDAWLSGFVHATDEVNGEALTASKVLEKH